MSSNDTNENLDTLELVSFQVDGQEYCVEIMAIREIRGWSQATKLPHSPDYVCGVINLRGSVLPVLDLGARFGYGPTEPTARHVIMVTQIRNQTIGLLVESVSDILALTKETLQPTPQVASEAARNFVTGMIPMEDRMIRLLDLNAVLPDEIEHAA